MSQVYGDSQAEKRTVSRHDIILGVGARLPLPFDHNYAVIYPNSRNPLHFLQDLSFGSRGAEQRVEEKFPSTKTSTKQREFTRIHKRSCAVMLLRGFTEARRWYSHSSRRSYKVSNFTIILVIRAKVDFEKSPGQEERSASRPAMVARPSCVFPWQLVLPPFAPLHESRKMMMFGPGD